KDQHVFLLNPLSNDLSVLRQSMVDGGLKSLAYNLNRKQENLRFFEFGKTYHKENDSYVEKKHFSLFITGNQTRERWNTIERKNDFFFLKGTIDALLERIGLQPEYASYQDDLFSESLEIICKNKKIGVFGVLKSKLCKSYDVDQEVLYADMKDRKSVV